LLVKMSTASLAMVPRRTRIGSYLHLNFKIVFWIKLLTQFSLKVDLRQ